MHLNSKEIFIKESIIIISLFFLFLIVSPYYLFTTDQLYHALLDYSSFVPSNQLAGWDTRLLIFETLDSPFTPFLIQALEMYKSLSDNNMRLFQVLYKIISLTSIIMCYTYLIKNKDNTYILLFIFIYIISYQFIHEIERGQWNFISIGMVYLALIKKKSNKILSSLLIFSIAIQIKVFPLIFIPLFIFNKNSEFDYKYLIKLSIINCILLLSRGYEGLVHFIEITKMNSIQDPGAWEMNPSIKSIIIMINNLIGFNLNLFIPILIFLLLGTIIYSYYHTSNKQEEPYNFLALSVLAILLIPKSYDYRLSIIIIPIIYFFKIYKLDNLIEKKSNRLILKLILINFLILSIKTPSIYFTLEQIIKILHIPINYHNVDFIALVRSRTIPLISLTVLFFTLRINNIKKTI